MQALLILLICLVTLAILAEPLRRRLPGRIGLVAADRARSRGRR